MILLHDRTGNVEARATGRWLLLDPILGPKVFDRVRSLLRRLSTRGNGQGFIVKDTTRLAPKKLIHREANPVRMINLESKSFVESIVNRLSGSFNHWDSKTLRSEFGLDIFPQQHLHKIEGLFGRILRNQPLARLAQETGSLPKGSSRRGTSELL